MYIYYINNNMMHKFISDLLINSPHKNIHYNPHAFQKGKYELLKLIGQGMTSKVFMVRLASDHSKIFALKVITNEYWAKRKDYILNEVEVLK